MSVTPWVEKFPPLFLRIRLPKTAVLPLKRMDFTLPGKLATASLFPRSKMLFFSPAPRTPLPSLSVRIAFSFEFFFFVHPRKEFSTPILEKGLSSFLVQSSFRAPRASNPFFSWLAHDD